MARIKIVCGDCGSANVMRDAWAVSDTENQCWELGNVFDAGYCDDCSGESLVEQPAIEGVDYQPAPEPTTILGVEHEWCGFKAALIPTESGRLACIVRNNAGGPQAYLAAVETHHALGHGQPGEIGVPAGVVDHLATWARANGYAG